jgi:hypothetical protein
MRPSDFQIHLVEVPGPAWLGAALAQVRCDHRPEMIHPAPNGLVRNHNPALSQQVLHIAKAEREPKIQPDRLLDDLRREAISVVADFPHRLG